MSLLDRFIQYSLQHQRTIRVMVMHEDGQIKTMNLTVTGTDEAGIMYLSARNKSAPRHLPWDSILGASYARGDDGDTLRKQDT